MHPGRDEYGSIDPFDEFEDSPDDEPELEPPSDPYQRQRFERAKQMLDVFVHPRFRETLEEFRLEDPRRLVRRNARRLRERARLLDPSRLMMGTMARIVMKSDQFDGNKARPAWIDDRIDETIEDLLIEDQEDERAGLPVKEPLQSRYDFLVKSLQIETSKARLACIKVNELPGAERKVFFEVACMLEPTRKLVEAGLGKKGEIRNRLRSALAALENGGLGFDSRNFHQGTGKPFDLMGGYDA